MRKVLPAVFLALTACCPAAEYSGVVAFGDSLSDMGNRWLSPSRPDAKFRAPAVVTRSRLGGALAPTYLAAMTKAVRAHNAKMEEAITRLRQAFPGLTIIRLDLFSRLAEFIANPEKYGIVDVTKGANDGKHRFSADGLHPTSYGRRLLAEYAFQVLTAGDAAAAAPSR